MQRGDRGTFWILPEINQTICDGVTFAGLA